MSQDKAIRFIRVHGRVIPIRMNKATSRPTTKKTEPKGSLPKAASFLGAGALSSIGGGYAAGKYYKKATLNNAKSKLANQYSQHVFRKVMGGEKMGVLGLNMLRKAAQKEAAAAKSLKRSKLVFKIGTGLLGGLLIGQGLSELLKRSERRKLTDTEETVTHAAGVASVFLGNLAFRKAAGSKWMHLLRRIP